MIITRLALAITVALSGAVQATTPEERIAALETRIAALEAELKSVLPTASAMPKAPPASAPATQPSPIQQTAIVPNALPGTTFMFTGLVKLDAMLTRTSDGELADGSTARDLYVPGAIPVGGSSEGTDLDAHAKFTRLQFGTDTVLDNAATVQARIEGDFFGAGLGDERFNNASGFVVRHAYLNYDSRWLVGQTWSTFMDAATLPESTDLIGPTDGTVFVRQPMLRYTAGPWMFALENPETTITAATGARISSDDSALPDLIVRYNWKTDSGGTLGAAALIKQNVFEQVSPRIDDRALGGGLTLFGKLPLGADDVRFGVTAGRGINRYVGLNADNDAALAPDGTLDLISGQFGYAAYRHVFNPKLRGSLFFALARYDNPSFAGLNQTKSSESIHANLFHSPHSKFDIGAELVYAHRGLESGLDGDLWRLHTTIKYSF